MKHKLFHDTEIYTTFMCTCILIKDYAILLSDSHVEFTQHYLCYQIQPCVIILIIIHNTHTYTCAHTHTHTFVCTFLLRDSIAQLV